MRGFLTQWRPPEVMVDYSQTLANRIAAAADGDTIELPAGVVNLSRHFNVSKKLTIAGKSLYASYKGSTGTTVRARFNGATDFGLPIGAHFIFNETGLYDVLQPAYDIGAGGRKLTMSANQSGTSFIVGNVPGDSYVVGQYYILVGGQRGYHVDNPQTQTFVTNAEVVRLSSASLTGSNWTITIQAPEAPFGAESPYTSVSPAALGCEFSAVSEYKFTQNPLENFTFVEGKLVRTNPNDIRPGFGLRNLHLDGTYVSGVDGTSGIARAIFARREAVAGFTGCIGPEATDVHVSGFTSTGLGFTVCRNVRIQNFRASNARVGSLGYGLTISSCRGVLANGIYAADIRKSILISAGGSDMIFKGIFHEWFPEGTLLDNYATAQSAVLDVVHGLGTKRVKYSGVFAPYAVADIANPAWRAGFDEVTIESARLYAALIYCNATNLTFKDVVFSAGDPILQLRSLAADVHPGIKLHSYFFANQTPHWNGFVKSLTLNNVSVTTTGFPPALYTVSEGGVPERFGVITLQDRVKLESTINNSAARVIKLASARPAAGATINSPKLEFAGTSLTLGPKLMGANLAYFMEFTVSGVQTQDSIALVMNNSTLDGVSVPPPHILTNSGTAGSLAGTGNKANLAGGSAIQNNGTWSGTIGFTQL
jgi:hypothetical protein